MQPLSQVARDATHIKLGSTVHFDNHPKIAMLAMKIVAGAVTIDSAFARTFVALMRAEPHVGAAMFLKVTADTTRDVMLSAAADEVLSELDRELFGAVRSVTASALKMRHKMAHWTWGASPDVPDGMLICDPKDYVPLTAAHAEYKKKVQAAKTFEEAQALGDMLRMSRDRIFVVTEGDLTRALEAIVRAQKYALDFESLVVMRLGDSGGAADQLHNQLRNEPEIATALARSQKPKADPKGSP